MNKNTAGAMRAACSQVLGVLDNWQTVNVTELDVDDVLKRFKTLRYSDFKPESLETYDQRFRQALRSYLAYVQDPGKWRFSTRDRAVTASKNGGGRAKAKQTPESTDEDDGTEADSTPRLGFRSLTPRDERLDGGRNTYPFPLRAGFTAQLVLPPDLKASEVKRLSTFMSTLVAEEGSSA
jgi:hypothetical protein